MGEFGVDPAQNPRTPRNILEENMNDRNRKHPRYGKKKYSLATIAIAAACVLAVLVGLAMVISLDLELTMAGEKEITLEYGQQYKEPGVTATSGGKDLEVTAEGTVDVKKLGTYQITYSAQYLWLSKSVQRTVHVVDTVAPVITLQTKPDHITLPGADYVEEGFAASDNYDGDITDQVTTSFDSEKGVMVYTVQDSSGNETRVERVIKYSDPVPPEIILAGDTQITIQAGNTYTEPGYTATDNVDGDITDKVQVEGSVNTNRAGTYTITYSVTDSYGNTTKVTRTVTVKAASQPDQVTPSGKVIYLTFDDGPSKYTSKLLDVLEQYGVKATFFVCDRGTNLNKLMKDIVDGGHSIGIHSVTHDYASIYSNVDAFIKDLTDMGDIIYANTGVRTKLMRFPGGSSNGISKQYCKGIMTELVQIVRDMGYQYFDWNVDSDDAGAAKTAEEVFNNVCFGKNNGQSGAWSGCEDVKNAVVLQHDIKEYSVDAVEKIIQWGLANGYTFKALDMTSPAAHHGTLNN